MAEGQRGKLCVPLLGQSKIYTKFNINRAIHGPNRGGNWSNTTNCGAFYVNLNNSASNSNSNLSAANSY